MNRGLYIAMTSLVNNQKRMDVLSNNLANINTTGYKKEYSISESFPEKLLAKKNRVGEMRLPTKDNINFEENEGVYRASIKDGYFKVETPSGISHVKEINFIRDEDTGFLRTYYKNFKDDKVVLRENYILDRNGRRIRVENNTPAINTEFINSIIYKPKNFIIGTMSGGVKYKRSFTDFTQGGIVDTSGSLDLALLGDGFFKVETPSGIKYTRNGNFSLNKDNELVDMDGRLILSTRGEPIIIDGEEEAIKRGEINISENGVVALDGEVKGTIGVVRVANSQYLKKVGDNLYEMGLDENKAEVEAIEEEFDGRILQNHLESSNMNPIDGMVDMISLMREFEANQKIIRMQDEMLEKATTEIGKI